MQHSGHMGQILQTEIMFEIYSKILVRAIGKVLQMKSSYRTLIKTRKGDEKQTTVLVVRINNIGQYQCCFYRLLAH